MQRSLSRQARRGRLKKSVGRGGHIPANARIFACVLSKTETNSGEAQSNGNQEGKGKKRAPHGHVPPLAQAQWDFYFVTFFGLDIIITGGIRET